MNWVRRFSFIVVIALFMSGCLQAEVSEQGTIRGLVTFSDGTPIPGIALGLGEVTAVSSVDGEYVFSEIPFGTHSLNVIIADKVVHSESIEVDQSEQSANVSVENSIELTFANFSFEEPIVNNDVPGWDIRFTSGYTAKGYELQRSTQGVVDGDYSLRMESPDPSEDSYVRARAELVEGHPGWVYIGFVDAYTESGPAQAFVEFWETESRRHSFKTVRESTTGVHVKLVPQGIAPEGIKYVRFAVFSGETAEGVAYYDQARLWAIPVE